MSLPSLHDQAAELRKAGRLDEAEALYRRILALQPGDFAGAYQLSLMLFGQGRYAEALAAANTAIAARPEAINALIMGGLALQALGRPGEALTRFDAALALEPGNETVHANRGGALAALGRHENALASFDRALVIKPGMVSALNNRGNVLLAMKRAGEALSCFDQVLTLAPDFPAALHNRGEALRLLGRLEEALAAYELVLAREADSARAQNGKGLVLQELGRMGEAISCHREAIARDADFAEAWAALGRALVALGDVGKAEAAWGRALQAADDVAVRQNLALLLTGQQRHAEALAILLPLLREDPPAGAGAIFALCVRNLRSDPRDPELATLMARALREGWARPSDLAEPAARFVLADPVFPGENFEALSRNDLLMALLTTVPNVHLDLERVLGRARLALLERAEKREESDLTFFAALAGQCVINEYVSGYSSEEISRARQLRVGLASALRAKAIPSSSEVVAVACYFPLLSVPGAERLLDKTWPAPVEALLTLALREPIEEKNLGAGIPCLTPMGGAVTAAVKAQYEENPYPRWIVPARQALAESIGAYLRHKFPLAPLNRNFSTSDVLIAGCGTGQHSIATARKFPDARILAVDLSRASLAYALRKSRALGLDNIEYAEADLLRLAALDCRFDIIESSGVLHHLADPFAGWGALLSLLKPGGVMMLGLYSAKGRRSVAHAREFIRQKHIAADPDEIRHARQALIAAHAGNGNFASVTGSPDFFSLSACRDLLFHVQEQVLTLEEIADFIGRNGLVFLGFEIGGDVLATYRREFPGDLAGVDLRQWQVFEARNPDIFAGMYQFWVQKPLAKGEEHLADRRSAMA